MSCAAKQDPARRRARSGAGRSAPRSTCRSRIRRQGRASRRVEIEGHVRDRLDQLTGPRDRRMPPHREVLVTCCTDRIGSPPARALPARSAGMGFSAVQAMPPATASLGEMAGDAGAADLAQRRLVRRQLRRPPAGSADGRRSRWAAAPATAAQPSMENSRVGSLVDVRERGEQAARVGMARCRRRSRRPAPLDDATGIHDRDRDRPCRRPRRDRG